MKHDDRERRKVGGPRDMGDKGSKVFTRKCDIRLTSDEDRALSRIAERNGTTRSDVLRKALRDFIIFNEEGR